MSPSVLEPRPPAPLHASTTTVYLLTEEGGEPIRAELFGRESLEASARALAGNTQTQLRSGRQLMRRLVQNGHYLRKCLRRLTTLVEEHEPLTHEAEWLLDNGFVIDEVLTAVRRDMPRGFYRELPKVANGPLSGYPRVYTLALTLVAHTDSALDEDNLSRFVEVYQTVAPLTIGEIWAVPIMLRLALLENLRRLGERMIRVLDERSRAQVWAARRATHPSLELPPKPMLSDPFVVRILQGLRDKGAAQAVQEIEEQLSARGIQVVEVVQRENQRQAVDQVSVGNAVTSIRLLGMVDWNVFFERTSGVEVLLRQDPSGIYARQDFTTRDYYRQAVEKLARRSRRTEEGVVQQVLTLARTAQTAPGDMAANHVGYHLVGGGKEALRLQLGYRPDFADRLRDTLHGHAHLAYFGSIATFALLGLAILGFSAGVSASPWLALAVAVLALLPAIELAIFLTNTLVTRLLPPSVFPRMEYKDGIPEEAATFVVMPCMLTSAGSAAELLRRLEIHYLTNTDPQLRFALLTDFSDAPAEQQPADEAILEAALAGIAELNERHNGPGSPRFFLFHRARRWNPAQGCWMGWERKRGKLSEFNRLLRGDKETSYTLFSSPPESLPNVRYVITLDSDTRLPLETARRLIGTLSHPLNRPRFDRAAGRVTSGYGILQPRISYHLGTPHRTLFNRIWTASAGVDPYSHAVSDVYQDLFGVGSFTGKGIYDVDAFEAATGHTFPENSILSHDLIEGNYARCGLVSDCEFFDDFPLGYHAYARRDHRWIRGDWQLLPWLGNSVPLPATAESATRRRANPLPLLARWKIIDNMRRSLVAPALILMVLLGWTVLPGSPWLWTGAALAVLTAPLLVQLATTVGGGFWRGLLSEVRGLRYSTPATAGQVLLGCIFLADQARHAVDAIGRTLYRLFVTRKNMLEWETAAATERRLRSELWHFWLDMWIAPALALASGVLIALVHRQALPAALPLLIGWLLSPWVAYRVSRTPARIDVPLSQAERQELRLIARKTWKFFETFVGEEDHWLPPDNYQEVPEQKVAHRTSPTNKGLLLLSTLSAHDLGYISLGLLLDRLEKTFATLDILERYQGHFLNWYDTRTLKPLQPAYVSTVDSGNLAGCLITLQQGLLEKMRVPWSRAALIAGLADTFAVVRETEQEVKIGEGGMDRSPPPGRRQRVIARLLERAPGDLPGMRAWLMRLGRHADELAKVWPRRGQHAELVQRLRMWTASFSEQIRAALLELDGLAPWLALLAMPAAKETTKSLGEIAEVSPVWMPLWSKLIFPDTVCSGESQRQGLVQEIEEVRKRATNTSIGAEVEQWLNELALGMTGAMPGSLRQRCEELARRAEAMARGMDFRLLYRPDRHLFAIGFTPGQNRLDSSSYDLLASECRLTSFLTVARGEAPRRHWFHLGRQVTVVAGDFCLLSWGGTMFEYLMPELILPCYPGTLLAESRYAAVNRQIQYGRQRHVPWGISESSYCTQNVSLDYQYQAFGVPGLGLKRGLVNDLVVAPYATALAVMVRPHQALANFRDLARDGAAGTYGFYEAIDYTKARLPAGRRSLVVRSYMAHHQGMILIALVNCLHEDVMPRRFHAEPRVRAADLLLQEKPPVEASPTEPEGLTMTAPAATDEGKAVCRILNTANTSGPRTHLLSNGRYTVMVTNAGGGFSICRGQAISRWREDYTRDSYGQFQYISDLESGHFWSATHQPLGRMASSYEVIYSADKAEFHRFDEGISTSLEITVPPEHQAEVRRLHLTNHTDRVRELEVTSYLEVVLAPAAADLAHPAFGKLFLETEWLPASQALLCRRRPRAEDQQPIWAVHVLASEGTTDDNVQFETDRARFLGRGRSPGRPAALDPGERLSGTTGPVLDPILSIRKRIRLAPERVTTLSWSTALAETREEALALADHYRDPHTIVRAFELAWAHSQVELRHLQLPSGEAHLYQRLAANLLIAGPMLRGDSGALLANRLGLNALWRHGISGDRPIALVHVGELDELPLVRQLLDAHGYWRLKGLEVDLVLLNGRPTSYQDELQTSLQDLIRTSSGHSLVDKPGGIFLRQADQLLEEERQLLESAARLVIHANRGPLARQLEGAEVARTLPTNLVVPRFRDSRDPLVDLPSLPDLQYANGIGAFTGDGREYVIRVCPRPPDGRVRFAPPPAPWCNVVANPNFGFLISEMGGGYTWAGNSQTNRLTPWTNDQVTDTQGEVIYLRDEGTGVVWTPTPLPLGTGLPTRVRHGQGYTVFEQHAPGLSQRLQLLVPLEAPVKVFSLRVRNDGSRIRSLSATFYAEWVLGTLREQAPLRVRTEVDAASGVLLAHNPYAQDFGTQVAFADVSVRPRSLTADRTEFLGRNGSVANPAAMRRVGLSGRVGVALDPCAALHVAFELRPGEEKHIVFVLGAAADAGTARQLALQYRNPAKVGYLLDKVRERWDSVLGAVQVQTPDKAVDLLLNRWLPYQVLSCRVWGRTGFYQSGGAYGFRDQLQDVMALVYGAPQEARAHILRAAAHQFVEGDVQHWWHPPAGRGVRTHFSDDYLWLPYVVSHYVTTTGDTGVLNEQLPFLTGPRLRPEQEDDYGLPSRAEEAGTLYEHCARALDHGLRFGVHGLPLMGTGDWNDGMNRVGAGGKGESVWVGWFLLACLERFRDHARQHGDTARLGAWDAATAGLKKAIEEQAWDGGWYRRAWFDDGTPLGSAVNEECKIDSIAQSWAVISGAGDPARASQAMDAVQKDLVHDKDGLILLFTPPFDKSNLQPGYIKGYVPGIRENGGQYTHAAIWTFLATAMLGQGRRAGELLDMLNPIRRSGTPEGVATYRVEPYVVAADIYGVVPHVGRGGWTWYTGSAAWLYRAILETLLGFRLEGTSFRLMPCLPPQWDGFTIAYRHRSTTYQIRVENPGHVETGCAEVILDGGALADKRVPLVDDGRTHEVVVRMG